MPPKSKSKESASRRQPQQVHRLPISNSSLVYTPEDVLEGFQERLETGIEWNVLAAALRHHRQRCRSENLPCVPFSEALQNKISSSILNGFFDDSCNLSFEDLYELIVISMWDIEKFATDEAKKCFESTNCITDNIMQFIKRAVKIGNREVLRKELKLVEVLRVNGSQMTELDSGLSEFRNLVTLNLCGNFIATFDAKLIPPGIRILELQANRIENVETFAVDLPSNLTYIGLARNLLTNDGITAIVRFPYQLTILDLSDNDIYHLEPLLEVLARLPNLVSLQLAGNPCAVCTAYARTTLMRLLRLQWLDSREVLVTDRTQEPYEPHPDMLRSAFFNFAVLRVISALAPPKPEKGTTATFHLECEFPLLDSTRRKFLMYRRNESLVELLPPPEDDEWPLGKQFSEVEDKSSTEYEQSHESDIYHKLTSKNSREILHFTTFESNRVQWSKIMNFQEPAVRIFCPDLTALRDTFRTTVTLRLIYTLNVSLAVRDGLEVLGVDIHRDLNLRDHIGSVVSATSRRLGVLNKVRCFFPLKHLQMLLYLLYKVQTTTGKQGKGDRKSALSFKCPGEQRATLATIKCSLQSPDWSQPSQHFHWDSSLGTDEAIHWGNGDLSVLQYSHAQSKPTKSKTDNDMTSSRQTMPDCLTCHFAFGIETIRT